MWKCAHVVIIMLHISPNHMLPTILLPQLGFSTKSTYALIINIFILPAINTRTQEQHHQYWYTMLVIILIFVISWNIFIRDLTIKHLKDCSGLSVQLCIRKSHFLTGAPTVFWPKDPDLSWAWQFTISIDQEAGKAQQWWPNIINCIYEDEKYRKNFDWDI